MWTKIAWGILFILLAIISITLFLEDMFWIGILVAFSSMLLITWKLSDWLGMM